MTTPDKKQFLDPLSCISRLILLYFSQPNTKLRIINHTIQLIPPSYAEILFRNWYKDSRNDICVLYATIIRFITHLLEKQKKLINQKSHNIHNSQTKEELNQDETCYKYLKLLGTYTIFGMQELQKTYNYDNSVFALQFYSNLIKNAINGTYDTSLLPPHLQEYTNQNLLDISKIQQIWTDSHIIELSKIFENAYNAKQKNDIVLLNGYLESANKILEQHDILFKNAISIDGETM